MILPLPVKKNKFGERVADISVDRHYRQIAEEIIEACTAQGKNDEARKLVDVITCCVTRLDILQDYVDDDEFEDFSHYLRILVQDFAPETVYGLVQDFEPNVVNEQTLKQVIDEQTLKQVIADSFYPSLAVHFARAYYAVSVGMYGFIYGDDELHLAGIIYFCVKRLEYLGYDESAREKLYQAVNDKNRKRGYFEN